MTWARFEDRFPWHRKVRGLPDPAFRLHVSAVCWSCEHLTDGHIPTDDLPLVSDVRAPAKALTELVKRGLWDVCDDGWRIHDFLVYNEPRAVILARREADAERKRRGREGRTPVGVQPDVQPDSGRESVRPVPSRPDPSTNTTRPAVADPDGFAEFWAVYPSRVGRLAAVKAYRKALKTTDAPTLLQGATRYRNDPARKPEFTAHASTWLNAGRWADEPAQPARPAGSVLHLSEPERQWAAQQRRMAERGGLFGDGAA